MSFIRKNISRKLSLPVIKKVDVDVKAFGGSSVAPKDQLNLVKVTLMSQFVCGRHEVEALEVPFICDHLIDPPQSHAFVQKLLGENKFIADFVSLPGLKTEVGISLLI